jgi:ABC-2 type transport system permease protein
MEQDLAPSWVQTIARFNPVNWAVEAGRTAIGTDTDWSLVASRVGLLSVLLGLSSALATKSFRAYQRSI